MTATLVPHCAPLTAPDWAREATPAASPTSQPPLSAADRVLRWGTTSVCPFTLGPAREVHELPNGGLVGFVRTGRWAVMATDPIAPPGAGGQTLDHALELIGRLRLRPLVLATADAAAHRDRGLWTMPIADDALIDLDGFTLAGGGRANVRHSVSAARRAGLSVVPWSPSMTSAAAQVSAAWLSTKRGGEMGFTLGRFDPDAMATLDGRVAVDGDGRIVALTTWHRFDDGRARVLDLMRRSPTAPNPAMDLLIAECLREFAADGVRTASLGSVPRSHGALAERVYPTASLRRYKDKFAPRWEARHLVTPRRRHLPAGLLAIAQAYSPDGLRAACRPNSIVE